MNMYEGKHKVNERSGEGRRIKIEYCVHQGPGRKQMADSSRGTEERLEKDYLLKICEEG